MQTGLIFFTGADCVPPLGFDREPMTRVTNFVLQAHAILSYNCLAATRRIMIMMDLEVNPVIIKALPAVLFLAHLSLIFM